MSPRPSEGKADRIAIYARISKEDTGRRKAIGAGRDPDALDGSSIESQVFRCRRYLESQHTADTVQAARIYRDEGFSGGNTDRPEFQRLLRDIRKGLVDKIVFTELSRVSRSVRDFLDLTEEFRDADVEFVSLREKFDTSSPHGRLLITILMALNQFEREQTMLRTKLNMRSRSERGLFNGGRVPLGYARDTERRGNLIIVEEEARTIRAVFDTYLELGSVPATVEKLKGLGYRRPAWVTTAGKQMPPGLLHWDMVRGILMNPVYIGEKEINRANRDLSGEAIDALPEEEKYRTTKAVWEPLIDRMQFERVQEMIAENGRRNGNIQRRRRHDFILTGLAFCGACGAALEGGSAKRAQYFYYRHPDAATCTCPQKAWRAEQVEEVVISRLARLADDEELLGLIIAEANKRIDAEAPQRADDLKAARVRVDELEREMRDLVSRLMSLPKERVPASFWNMANEKEDELSGARADVLRLEAQAAESQARRLHASSYREALTEFGKVFAALTPFDKARLLAYLVERVELGESRMALYLLEEDPDAQNVNRPESGYSPGGSWLRKAKAASTGGPVYVFVVEVPPPPPSSPTRVKLRQREDRARQRAALPSPAAQALERALAWQTEMEHRGLLRADIAAREGLARARITQLMMLLELPDDIRTKLLIGDPAVQDWSVRRAMQEVRTRRGALT